MTTACRGSSSAVAGSVTFSRLTCELEQGALQQQAVLDLALQPQQVDLAAHMMVSVPEG